MLFLVFKQNKFLIIFFAIVLFFLSYITLFSTGNIGDEGIILTGAQRILSGEIIFRDFFTWIPPGIYYLSAGTMAIFGQKYIIIRILTLTIAFIDCVLIYLTSRALIGKFYSCLSCLIFIWCFYPLQMNWSYHWLVLMFILISTLLIDKFWQKNDDKLLIWAGAILAIGGFFMHTRAGLMFIILTIAISYNLVKKVTWRQYFKKISFFVGSFILLSLLLYAYFLFKAGLEIVWQDLITNNFSLYLKVNYAPIAQNLFGQRFIFSSSLLSYLLLTIILVVHKAWQNKTLVLYYATAWLMFASVTYRLDYNHLAYVYMYFNAPLFFYAFGILKKRKNDVWHYGSYFLVFFLFFPVIVSAANPMVINYLSRSKWHSVDTKMGRVYFLETQYWQSKSVLQEIDKIPDQEIFIFPYASYYYAWSGKKNPTKYDQIYDDYLSADAKNEILKNLQEKNTRYALFLPKESGVWEAKDKYFIPWFQQNFAESIMTYHDPNEDTYYWLYTKK